MRIDRSHLPWLLFTAAATALAAISYAAYFYPRNLAFSFPLPALLLGKPKAGIPCGATPLGLLFGTLSFAIFLFASALGIRKKERIWPIGKVRLWVKAHVWLTTLTIPLVLFHSGFTCGGALAQWLMALYAIVMLSGFLGIALQQVMPRVMKERLPREVVFEQIPRMRAALVTAASELREELNEVERHGSPGKRTVAIKLSADPSIPVLSEFIDADCLPYLSAKRGDRMRLGDAPAAAGIFGSLKANVAPDWRPKVDELEQWCNERRWMDLQTKFQLWLHAWLLVHVPASFALLIFTTWHAWAAIRFLVLAP